MTTPRSMAATPKKGGATASAASSTFTRKRSTLALAATAVLIASVCGAIAAAFVFYGTAGDNTSNAATAAATSGRQYDANANTAATTESATVESNCQTQRCKAGGSEVCGTDGKTYLNDCFFQNAQCKNTTLTAVKDWKGYNCPHTCMKKIACSEVGKFLCASDGNVYFGYCNLYIAQCMDPTIKEVECDKYIFEGVFGH